jgi:alginate O-acetyltransferase complex protein AlgI
MIPRFKRAGSGRTAAIAARGMAIFAAGLFKKVGIADNLSQFFTPVFSHPDAAAA